MSFLAVALAVNEDRITPGLLGLTVVVLLGLATWLLLRSLNRQLKKVNFEQRNQDQSAGPGRGEQPDRQDQPDAPAGQEQDDR